jgi:hypothetical protein
MRQFGKKGENTEGPLVAASSIFFYCLKLFEDEIGYKLQ